MESICHRAAALVRSVLFLGLAIGCPAGLGAPSPAEPVRFAVARFEVTGDNPLDQDRSEAILAPYRIPQQTLAGLLAAAKALEQAIRAQGYAFHRVILPPQALDGGPVRLEVVAFRLGRVEVPADAHYDAANLRASLPPLKEGETLNLERLSAAVDFANRHPYKEVELVFRPGADERRVDARLDLAARDPQHLFLVLNNTGNAETGHSRLALLYQHANLWDSDHELMASYTGSPEYPSDVVQLGLSYGAPLYAWGGRLDLFGLYSNVDSGRVADFEVSGAGTVLGFTYSQALPAGGGYRHDLRLGITDKLFDNDVRFAGTQLGHDVRSRPLGLQYAARHRDAAGSLGFDLQWNVNLGGGAHNSAADYSANREGAPRGWQAWRLDADGERRLGASWLLRGRFHAQYSDDPLIPGEQIGVGGVDSVRGYKERELGGDSGYTLGLELGYPRLPGGFGGYGFFDMGARYLENTVADQSDEEMLRALGLGLDWHGLEGLTARADLAYALDDGEQTDAGELSVHFNLTYRF